MVCLLCYMGWGQDAFPIIRVFFWLLFFQDIHPTIAERPIVSSGIAFPVYLNTMYKLIVFNNVIYCTH